MIGNPSPAPEVASPPRPTAAIEPGAHGAQGRLLVVDDIADNRAILTRRFSRHGFQITEADGGRRALELIAEQDFDLVLLDVLMPDLDGLQVLRAIRETYSQAALPVIMVTAVTQVDDIVRALDLGANEYITKPVNFPVALARANTQLGLKRAETALLATNAELERRVRELLDLNQRLEVEMAHRERSQERIHYLAHYDALTGLPNRALFREQLDEAFGRSRRTGEAFAILFLDLDCFKSINDTLGHSIGDALLNRISDRLRDSLRDTDRIARLGGDEFAVIQLSSEQPRSAAVLASRLIELIGSPYVVEGHQLEIGVSIGIAVSAPGSSDPEQLLKSADLAMYRAKADGRGSYRFFEPQMDAAARTRRALEIDLRAALGRGEFRLHYQPLVNLRSDKVTGFEALMRWKHPGRGLVSPSEFVPVAEEMGLIVQIGE